MNILKDVRIDFIRKLFIQTIGRFTNWSILKEEEFNCVLSIFTWFASSPFLPHNENVLTPPHCPACNRINYKP